MSNMYGFENLCSYDDLSHHGIKGQKWGIMHGPPYPLSEKVSSAIKNVKEKYDERRIKKINAYKQKVDKIEADWKKLGVRSSSFKKSPIGRDYPYLSTQAQKNECKKRYEESIKASKLRASYKLKMAKNEELTDEEKKQRAKDAAIKCALVGATLVGSYYLLKSANSDVTALFIGTHDGTSLSALLRNSDPTKALADKDFVMKAGQEFYRTHAYRDLDLTYPHLYVSPEKVDAKLYQAFLGAGITRAGTGEKFRYTMTAQKDIKAPSLRKSIDILAKMLDEDDDAFDELYCHLGIGGPITTNRVIKRNAWNNLDALTKEKSLRKLYSQLNIGIVNDTYSSPRYIEAVKKAGYNAIMDLNDVGSFTTKPMILLDAQKDVVVTGRKTITALDEKLGLLSLPLSTVSKIKNAASSQIEK